MNPALLTIQNLQISFPRPKHKQLVPVVKNLSLSMESGQILGLVGESGAGKTLTGLSIGKLLPPTARWNADTYELYGKSLKNLTEEEMCDLRGDQVAYIFQDPAAYLNPVLTIEEQVCEVLIAHRRMSLVDARHRAVQMLSAVQLPDPPELLKSYPHQLSGGMQQRILIAMAILLEPALLIADEPTSALDSTIAFGILKLLKGLNIKMRMAVLLISHDLNQVASIADSIAVMQAGQIVEIAKTQQILQAPKHPYTKLLLAANPKIGAGRWLPQS